MTNGVSRTDASQARQQDNDDNQQNQGVAAVNLVANNPETPVTNQPLPAENSNVADGIPGPIIQQPLPQMRQILNLNETIQRNAPIDTEPHRGEHFVRARARWSDALLENTPRAFTDTGTGIEFEMATNPVYTGLEATMFNQLSLNALSSLSLESNFRQGFFAQIRDANFSMSAFAETSASATLRGNILGRGLLQTIPALGSIINVFSLNGEFQATMRVVRIWDNEADAPNRAATVAAVLSTGQLLGQTIGTTLGLNIFLPATGSSICD